MTKPSNQDEIDRQHERDLRMPDPRTLSRRQRPRMAMFDDEPLGLFERGLTLEEFIEP
jgi:hypothetical protein